MKRIIISTGNKNKVREMLSLLEDLPVEVLTKSQAGYGEIDPIEDGKTLEENAKIKVENIGEPEDIVIGDDTGLFVYALPNELGVHSSRYAGEHATDEDNRHKLCKAMEDKTDRRAYFKTVIAIKYRDKYYTVEGICRGHITNELKGTGGFGYDPMFQPEGCEKTFAELSEEEKNQISHRGKALIKAKKLLCKLI